MEDERNNLIAAKQELKSSIKAVKRDLKIYGKAKINYTKAKLMSVSNGVVIAFNQLKTQAHINKLDREKKRIDKEREKAEAHREKLERQAEAQKEKQRKKIERYEQREEKKQERNGRRLAFKSGVKQKANSFKSKLGTVKNSVLKSLSFKNLDLKIKTAFELAGTGALSMANSALTGINNAKDSALAFTSTQLDKFRAWKEEKIRQSNIAKAEKQEEINRKARLEERKKEMIEALNERDREEKERQREEKESARKQNRLNLKSAKKAKVSTPKSKLGTVKNSVLKGLSFRNIDLKIKTAFELAGISILTATNSTLTGINNAKDSALAFTSTQLDKFRAWKEEKIRQSNIAKAEKQEEINRKARLEERKKAMSEALNKQEREDLTGKYEKIKAKREEIRNALIEQKNRLLNIQKEPNTIEDLVELETSVPSFHK